MRTRMLLGLATGLVTLTVGMSPAAGQVSGRVVVGRGPIGVDIAFGTHPDVALYRPNVVRYVAREPVRYRPGMSRLQLERYLARIEYEYDLYRHMDAGRAYYELGWSRAQLRDYVHWLRDERRFLRAERSRLEKLQRVGRRAAPGHGRGHGRGVASAASRRW